jgi:SAM-dependent methyltransferase
MAKKATGGEEYMIGECAIAEEIKFYDGYYVRGERHITRGWFERCLVAFYPAGLSCREKLLATLGDVKGKRILELGCGIGGLTTTLAGNGAYVSAIDISPEAVKMTREKCEGFIGQVDVQRMDANNLHYTAESFDLVVGELILHHLDCIKAAREIGRVLKPHGKAVFVEPLACNPLLNIWRRLTPSIRTVNEKPLSYLDILEAGKYFSSVKYQEFALLPLLSSLVYLITFSHRAKAKSAEFLTRLDIPLLRLCKPLRRYSAEVLIEFAK